MRSIMNTSTLIINPLTPIKAQPVQGEVALLTFGNVTIQLEQQLLTSFVLLLQEKQEFNRTGELFAAGLKEICREMQFKNTEKMPKRHRDSDNKLLLGMDNLINPNSPITGDYLLFSKETIDKDYSITNAIFKTFDFNQPKNTKLTFKRILDAINSNLTCPYETKLISRYIKYYLGSPTRFENGNLYSCPPLLAKEPFDNNVYLLPGEADKQTFVDNHIPDFELEELITEIESKFSR